VIGNGFAVSRLAVEGPTRAVEHSVDLARHNEIVLVQSFYLEKDGRLYALQRRTEGGNRATLASGKVLPPTPPFVG
jgi:hypothetical protein